MNFGSEKERMEWHKLCVRVLENARRDLAVSADPFTLWLNFETVMIVRQQLELESMRLPA